MADIALSSDQIPPVVNESASDETSSSEQTDIVGKVSAAQKADIYLYSGLIDSDGADKFIEIAEQYRSKENVIIILTTHGGQADAAYKIARYFKRTYQRFTLCVFGPCKSAGTLLALGADSVVMSCWGEFGPLDVQLVKRDDLLFRNSGLDIKTSLQLLSDYAFTIFEQQFLELIMRSGGTISTRTASDIAQGISVGLLAPITGQIDPLQIGEVGRAIKVAEDYGERLGADTASVAQLVQGYSSHSFVIDFDEAKRLFRDVRGPDTNEAQLEQSLRKESLQTTGHDCIRAPYPHGRIIAFLEPKMVKTNGAETASNGSEDDNEEDHETNNE